MIRPYVSSANGGPMEAYLRQFCAAKHTATQRLHPLASDVMCIHTQDKPEAERNGQLCAAGHVQESHEYHMGEPRTDTVRHTRRRRAPSAVMQLP